MIRAFFAIIFGVMLAIGWPAFAHVPDPPDISNSTELTKTLIDIDALDSYLLGVSSLVISE
jgi:hypothetical protein